MDVVIVGAGFGGLYAIHKLRQQGLKVRAFEAGDGVGGTWYWNRYPGARCDVESMEYSYSFSEELQQEWRWSERYAPQPEILRYANHVADRFGLRDAITFGTRVTRAAFDSAHSTWTVQTDKGESVTARFFVVAGGCLSLPRMPDFPGRDSFQGKLYHTGTWPHEGVDFSGMRVGVIGTGSSGIQAIPRIAEQARHVTVFQRTANFSLPAWNKAMPEDYEAWFKAYYAARREKARYSSAGIANHPTPDKGALEVSDEERQKVYEAGWLHGGPGFTRIYKDILSNEKANQTMAEFVRNKIRAKVKDPAVAALLTPTDHAIGTKRICVDTDYYETYNRDNVLLVNVREHPIEQITPRGLRTTEKEYELDAIVFATGYDAVTGAILNIDIRVDGGPSLAEKWAQGPKTYLGLMTAGYPNLFMVTGPGSPSVLTNMITSIEQHIEWISDCLRYLGQKGIRRMEARTDYEEAWVRHVNDVADTTLFPRANSWYTGANIPGKPRVFLPYVGGHGVYRMKCADVAFKGYEGFTLQP
ncbi:MAG: NAD(P)/FAD-dependent oxidoreductase [Hydrogenophaga sp.]|nr:NAD(P)/FAD-dependent oxidoreductase [Hydrogenophaga sp.]